MFGQNGLIIALLIEVLVLLIGLALSLGMFADFMGRILKLTNDDIITSFLKYAISVTILGGFAVFVYSYSSEVFFNALPYVSLILTVVVLYAMGIVFVWELEEERFPAAIITGVITAVSLLSIIAWFLRMLLPQNEFEMLVRYLFGG